MNLGEKELWYVKFWEKINLVYQGSLIFWPQHLFNESPGIYLTWPMLTAFRLNRLTSWYFWNFCWYQQNWKFFMLHKSTGFWRIRQYLPISRHDVIVNKITRYFSCIVDISLWLKFGGYNLYRTKVMQFYIL